jgi:hypothetical protein
MNRTSPQRPCPPHVVLLPMLLLRSY